jgi:hypothetical protein
MGVSLHLHPELRRLGVLTLYMGYACCSIEQGWRSLLVEVFHLG